MAGPDRQVWRGWRPPRRPARVGAEITAACAELRLALTSVMAAISAAEMALLRLAAERDAAAQGAAEEEEVDHGA